MIKISRKKVAENQCEYWNAFNVVLAMADVNTLSGVMRECHLVYYYASEVWNGGHLQYFTNKSGWDHNEVLAALKSLGAHEHAAIFEESLMHIVDVNQGLEVTKNDGKLNNILLDLDKRLYDTNPELFDFLEEVQRKHEAELVKWIE